MENRKRKIALFGIGGLIVLFLVIGVSYALWTLNLFQTNENVVTTGCFKINFTEKNDINLNNAYPIEDEAGRKLTPYEFTIENTCDSIASYQVNLEILDTTTLMNHEYIKVMFDEKVPRVLTEYNEVQKTLDNVTNAYKLEIGSLGAKESKTFTLRLWMDENTPPVDEAMNKIFKSKVTITTSYKAPVDTTNMMVEMNVSNYRNNTYTQNEKYAETLKKIVYESTLSPHSSATEIVDFSLNQDRSVLGYYVPNEINTEYTLYIQADGKIKTNTNADYFFFGYEQFEGGEEAGDTEAVPETTSIIYTVNEESLEETEEFGDFVGEDDIVIFEGMENIDTSEARSMRYLFFGKKDLNLDLSFLDTSNVTDMSSMFWCCSSLTSLDLTSLDTTNVTNMSGMFFGCRGLTSLDLTPLHTTKVTDMSSMFEGCSSLTSLNLSSLDTVNVTDMSAMFSGCRELTSLDISNFNTLNVVKYGERYVGGMFEGCTNLTSIIYGDNFVYKSGAIITYMFDNCPANKPTHESWNGVFS